ncbi:MAG: putative quinol monooxygenase [Pyrinomonadaceae bacterium]
MIVSTIRMNLSADKRKELVQTFNPLLKAIREQEGCLSCRFYGEVGDEDAFIMIEEWETKRGWDNHVQSREFAILLGAMSLSKDSTAVELKLLTRAVGLESLKAVRDN